MRKVGPADPPIGNAVLDELPGSVGDASEEHKPLGRLGLGVSRGLDKRRRYECYEEDNEPIVPTIVEERLRQDQFYDNTLVGWEQKRIRIERQNMR
jgi:hypothetical protein